MPNRDSATEDPPLRRLSDSTRLGFRLGSFPANPRPLALIGTDAPPPKIPEIPAASTVGLRFRVGSRGSRCIASN